MATDNEHLYIRMTGDEGVKRTYIYALSDEEKEEFHRNVERKGSYSMTTNEGQLIQGELVESELSKDEFFKAYTAFTDLQLFNEDTDDDLFVIPLGQLE